MYDESIFEEIDVFMKNKKSIQGNVVWNKTDNREQYVAKFPLSNNNDIIMDFDFEGTTNASGRIDLRGGTLKIFHMHNDDKEKIMVCRMHVLPGNQHTNPRISNCDVSGKSFPAHQTRFYSWEDMKQLYKSNISNERHIARVVDGVNTLEESINFFLNYTNISGIVTLPEYDVALL